MKRVLINAVVLTVCAVAVLGIAKAFSFVRQVIGIPREAYASDWTAVFIIDHIRTSGEWPTGWHDLRDEYDRLAIPEHYAWTFEELQALIDVDWTVSISEIQDSDVPPRPRAFDQRSPSELWRRPRQIDSSLHSDWR